MMRWIWLALLLWFTITVTAHVTAAVACDYEPVAFPSFGWILGI